MGMRTCSWPPPVRPLLEALCGHLRRTASGVRGLMHEPDELSGGLNELDRESRGVAGAVENFLQPLGFVCAGDRDDHLRRPIDEWRRERDAPALAGGRFLGELGNAAVLCLREGR